LIPLHILFHTKAERLSILFYSTSKKKNSVIAFFIRSVKLASLLVSVFVAAAYLGHSFFNNVRIVAVISGDSRIIIKAYQQKNIVGQSDSRILDENLLILCVVCMLLERSGQIFEVS